MLGAAAGGYVLIRKATPHVQRMIHERALPAVRKFWGKVRGQELEDAQRETDEANFIDVQPRVDPNTTESVPGTSVAIPTPQMSAEEWYARFRAVFATRQLADDQWKLLSTVQVADDDAVGDLQREMARNRPEAVLQQVTRMLAAAPQTEEEANAEMDPLAVERDPGRGA